MKEKKEFDRLMASINNVVDIAYKLGLSEYYLMEFVYDSFEAKRKEEEVEFNNAIINGEIFRKFKLKKRMQL